MVILSENTVHVSEERIDKRGCEEKKKSKKYCDTKMITITRAKVGHKRQGSSGI